MRRWVWWTCKLALSASGLWWVVALPWASPPAWTATAFGLVLLLASRHIARDAQAWAARRRRAPETSI